LDDSSTSRRDPTGTRWGIRLSRAGSPEHAPGPADVPVHWCHGRVLRGRCSKRREGLAYGAAGQGQTPGSSASGCGRLQNCRSARFRGSWRTISREMGIGLATLYRASVV
jgi:hypothetical protein